MRILVTTRLILGVGVIVSLGFLIYALPPHPSLWPLEQWAVCLATAAWVISPYWPLFRRTRRPPSSNEVDLVILALAAGLTISSLSFYYYAFFINLTAFSGFWFFITPIFQWGAVLVVLILVKAWSKSRSAT